MLDIQMKKEKGQTDLTVYNVPSTKLDLFTYILLLGMEQKIFRGHPPQEGLHLHFSEVHTSCHAVLQGHSQKGFYG